LLTQIAIGLELAWATVVAPELALAVDPTSIMPRKRPGAATKVTSRLLSELIKITSLKGATSSIVE
jgi:hypothetical protein